METEDGPLIQSTDDLDEDKYEDAGELDMAAAQERLYLTRMPKIVWEALSQMNDDDEVSIGTLRVQGDLANPSKASLMLNREASAAMELVPQEFNLRLTGKSNANTFVFSEKNLPGFTRKTTINRPINAASKHDKAEFRLSNKAFRRNGYRKAIPKKTALIGLVQAEFACLPVENEQYAVTMERRARSVAKPKNEMQLLEGTANLGTILTAGSFGSSDAFNTFIRGAPQPPRRQQQKATRMPKNELRDTLFGCFARYKFWYIRDLKETTQQPEPWLRECLEDIAELVRQGAHANTWRLKDSSVLDPAILARASNLGGLEGAEESVAPAATGYESMSLAQPELQPREDIQNTAKSRDVKMED